nr:PH domain-containing protein [Pseudoalteromonas sp. MMG010]
MHVQLNWLMFYLPLIGVLGAFYYINSDLWGHLKPYLLVITPVLIITSLFYNVLNVRLQGVAVRAHDIALKKGVIWQKVTILPLARVQHIEIHRGPLERKLGLASLKLYSAGGMSADLQLTGLTHTHCKEIRQFVQNYGIDGSKEQAINHD